MLSTVFLAALIGVSAPPRSLVFGFDEIALYGPVEGRAVVYPSDLSPPGRSVGRSVEVDFDAQPAGLVMVRLPLDTALLPPGHDPRSVHVLRKNLLFGWTTVPAFFQEGKGRSPAVFVPLVEPGHYALVVGGPPLRDADPWFRIAQGDLEAWVAGHGGTSVSEDEVGVLTLPEGPVRRVVRSPVGKRAQRLHEGIRRFFRLPPVPWTGFGHAGRRFTLE